MAVCWQKEKQFYNKTVVELKSAQNDVKQLQTQLSKAKRKIDRMTRIVAGKESEHDVPKSQLRDAKVTHLLPTSRRERHRWFRAGEMQPTLSSPQHVVMRL